ncbi:MAG: PepSY domain-containing protein [Solirubrobacterales bacterium]
MRRSAAARYFEAMKYPAAPTVLLALALALAAPLFRPALADDGHDRARRAVQAGQVLPLEDILARARSQVGGEFIEAELEDERGLPVYEIKMITPDGRVVKLHYNAQDGSLMDKGRRR